VVSKHLGCSGEGMSRLRKGSVLRKIDPEVPGWLEDCEEQHWRRSPCGAFGSSVLIGSRFWNTHSKAQRLDISGQGHPHI
jgi:hypothetical protein